VSVDAGALDASPREADAPEATSPLEADAPDGASPPEADAPDGASPPEADAPEAATRDASGPDVAAVCASLPAPRVHFPFSDCAGSGTVRDVAGGATGTLEGAGVHCDRSPVGGALRFDGADDAGFGSYVHVAGSLDAGAPACGEAGTCSPGWPFGSGITVSALLYVASTGSYENILGQWYYDDSYIFNTYYDSTLGQQILRFSVQPAGAAQPANVSAALQPTGAPPSPGWSHWVGVYDGAAMTLYKDGQVVAAQNLDAGGALQCTGVPLELGVVGRQGPCADLNESYFTGGLGDLQIFDVALNAAQVQALECSLGWRAGSADASP